MKLLIVDEEIIEGGVDTLRRQLLPALAGEIESATWVLPNHAAGRFREVAAACGNIRLETIGSPGGLPRVKEAVMRRVRGAVPRGLIDERLRMIAARDRCDVCVTTCAFGQPIPDVSLPVAAFVSDLNPGLPQRVLDNIGQWVERADITFTISDFTASEVLKFKPVAAGRVYSIPLAPPPGPWRRIEGQPRCFYYPAAPNPHKNHLPLLDAARGLAARGLDFRLTLTGAGMNQFAQASGGGEVIERMRAFFAAHGWELAGRVVVAGDARPADVAGYFAEASCVVLPSAYEGYGLPLIEALSQGKRVICADTEPFREQVARHGCGDVVTFTPVGDAKAIEDAMAAHLAGCGGVVLSDDTIRERMERWTWADAARRCREQLETLTRHG